MEWIYVGDVNPEYGGYWYRWNRLYQEAEIVQVNDLESNIGADGLIEIADGFIYIDFDETLLVRALKSAGVDISKIETRLDSDENIGILIDAWLAYYGMADMDSRILVTCDYGGNKKSWEGIKPDIYETVYLHKRCNGDIVKYIKARYLVD